MGEGPRPLNLAHHYGFDANPYDPSPLGPTSDDSELFVGRGTESRTFEAIISSFDRGGAFVEGGIGVGKTSFVNVQQYRLRSPPHSLPILPSLNVIELQEFLTPTEFLLSVLSNSLNTLQTLNPEVEGEKEFRKLSMAVEETLTSTRSYQATLAGFGGGISRDVQATNPNMALLPVASKYLDDFAALAHGFGYEKIIVSINNLDILSPRVFIHFLNQVRDLMLVRDRFLWIFIGSVGTRALMEQNSRRVSELVMTDPIIVGPLTKNEIHEAIDARVRKFRSDERVAAPISTDVIDLLYDASNGEFRYILNRSRDILVRTMLDYPTTKKITLDIAIPILKNLTKAAVARANLTPQQREVLHKLAQRGPTQPKDFGDFGFNSVPAFLRYLRKFYDLRLVDRRENGREVVYVPRGDVTLAFQESEGFGSH